MHLDARVVRRRAHLRPHPCRQHVGLTDEIGDEARGRRLVQFTWAARLRHDGVVHHDDGVGDGQRLFLVVCHVDRGQAQGALELADLLAHVAAQLGVQVGQRLVEQQHARLEHQGARHCHALLLPARELVWVTRAQRLQAHQAQHLLRLLLHDVTRQAADLQAVAHVLHHPQVREQRIRLEDHRDIALRRRQPRDVIVADQDAAVADLLQPGDHAQRRRLAAARRAQQRGQAAGLEAQRHAVDGGRRLGRVALGHRLQVDGGGLGADVRVHRVMRRR